PAPAPVPPPRPRRCPRRHRGLVPRQPLVVGAAPHSMKLLITGAGGQVGTELLAVLADHEVTGLTHGQLDVGDRDAVRAAVSGLRPDAVVHAAAWTAVDACEGGPRRALRDDARGTAH